MFQPFVILTPQLRPLSKGEGQGAGLRIRLISEPPADAFKQCKLCPFPAKEMDKLVFGERVFFVQGVDEPGALGIPQTFCTDAPAADTCVLH